MVEPLDLNPGPHGPESVLFKVGRYHLPVHLVGSTMLAVGLERPPEEFDKSRPPSAEQMATQRALSHGDVQTLERCIAEHHEVELDYTDAKGNGSTIRMRPAFIRYSAAEHLVLWGIPDEGHWEDLRLDRIHSVRDTGQEFSPSW